MQEILTRQLSEERSRVVSKVFELLDMYTDYFNPNMLEKIKNAIRHEFPSVSK